MNALRFGRLRYDTLQFGRVDEFCFSLVPFGEYFRGWRTTKDTRVNQPCETNVWDVAGTAEDALKVPDGLCTVFTRVSVASMPTGKKVLRFRVDFVEKPSTVVLIKDASKPPGLMLEWLHILYLDEKDITWLCTLNLKRSRQVVDACKVDIQHIIC